MVRETHLSYPMCVACLLLKVALGIIFFIYVALADKIIILDIVLTPSGVDVHHKSKNFQLPMLLLKYICSEA